MTEAIELLRPWVRTQYGEEVHDPAERLDAFQAFLPGELPQDYADTLLHYGRAVSMSSDTCIRAIEKAPPRDPGQFTYMSDTPGFNMLYGLHTQQHRVYGVFYAWDTFRDRMPPGLVPIGGDSMGNQICLDVSETGRGRIHSWFHEGDPGPDDAQGRPGWANTFLLATSFTDLLRRLQKDEPPPRNGPIGRICRVGP